MCCMKSFSFCFILLRVCDCLFVFCPFAKLIHALPELWHEYFIYGKVNMETASTNTRRRRNPELIDCINIIHFQCSTFILPLLHLIRESVGRCLCVCVCVSAWVCIYFALSKPPRPRYAVRWHKFSSITSSPIEEWKPHFQRR